MISTICRIDILPGFGTTEDVIHLLPLQLQFGRKLNEKQSHQNRP
jgi:hypothetical protein